MFTSTIYTKFVIELLDVFRLLISFIVIIEIIFLNIYGYNSDKSILIVIQIIHIYISYYVILNSIYIYIYIYIYIL